MRWLYFRRLAVAAALACGAVAHPAAAQPAPPLPPNVAQLETMLAQKHYLELGRILTQTKAANDIVLNMNWERTKMVAGATAFINFNYAYDLWRIAAVLPPEQANSMRETAVMVLLYAYELIVMDGVKCADVSAPGHRQDQIFASFAYIWKHVATLSEQQRAQLVDIAQRLEASTAAKRADDDFLCRDGLDQMRDALARNGNKPLPESSPQPGQIGKTVNVPANPDYQPKFVSKDVWQPKQSALRVELPQRLQQLVQKAGAAK